MPAAPPGVKRRWLAGSDGSGSRKFASEPFPDLCSIGRNNGLGASIAQNKLYFSLMPPAESQIDGFVSSKIVRGTYMYV